MNRKIQKRLDRKTQSFRRAGGSRRRYTVLAMARDARHKPMYLVSCLPPPGVLEIPEVIRLPVDHERGVVAQ
jgi:hypothetical protein